ncbi:predicted coding region AF_0233 [Archaeoglobus fulgidus DSM 4304]|uniref:Uncharacterized protein AF_0233 n=1 Tax=Archaeoglobus fulgidus (strain ATCC 49558 / DSM 4304 / JCM 9628 / NBRC 100126 / VC-16) TaxID=224325 RepID=Y233_ARCFU|nr:RecName: Full=Uncharacterized protein AF_0233 [Archaeoglobus fulgidus DSM 4304]AAB91013.1 predicted coding region AF_0233 [Archaeoglobus fulgidus DSM 4304]
MMNLSPPFKSPSGSSRAGRRNQLCCRRFRVPGKPLRNSTLKFFLLIRHTGCSRSRSFLEKAIVLSCPSAGLRSKGFSHEECR